MPLSAEEAEAFRLAWPFVIDEARAAVVAARDAGFTVFEEVDTGLLEAELEAAEGEWSRVLMALAGAVILAPDLLTCSWVKLTQAWGVALALGRHGYLAAPSPASGVWGSDHGHAMRLDDGRLRVELRGSKPITLPLVRGS